MSFQPAKNISKNTGNYFIHKHNNIVNKIFSSNLTVGGQRRCLYVKYTQNGIKVGKDQIYELSVKSKKQAGVKTFIANILLCK